MILAFLARPPASEVLWRDIQARGLEAPVCRDYLRSARLQTAIKDEIFAEKIQNDFTGGVRSGVNGTPSFFVNKIRFNGSFEYENLLWYLEGQA